MNVMWFRVAQTVASAMIVGCSSRVELDVDREKIATAVEVEGRIAALSEQPSTSVHFGVESTVTDPVLPENVETHEEPTAAVADSPPTEVRQEEVQQEEPATQVQMNVTTITLGDISIHIGDNTELHQQAQVQTQAYHADTSPAEQPPVSVPHRRSRPTTSQAARDAYHQRLQLEHEMRVRRWQSLFEQ